MSDKGRVNIETPEILWPAIRQYRHNTGSEDLLAGFDWALTCEVVRKQQATIERLRRDLDNIKVRSYELNQRELHDMALAALREGE
jgi:hypothetical protein